MVNLDNFKIIEKISIGKYWGERYQELQKKTIKFSYHLTDAERKKYEEIGFARITNLSTYLKKKFGKLENFDLIFFKDFENNLESFYIDNDSNPSKVFIDIEDFQNYQKIVQPLINQLHVTKYYSKISREYHAKIPKAFFNKLSPTDIAKELAKSDYSILEDWISKFESMDNKEKSIFRNTIEKSPLGTELLKKYSNLDSENNLITYKKFLNILEQLSKEEFNEIMKEIRTKKGKELFTFIQSLSDIDRQKIIKKTPQMIRMHDQYEMLKKSLKEFEKMIQNHFNSFIKNEKEIHLFLNKNPWLLGIEYFDSSKFVSDYNSNGEITGDTKIGKRKHADFIIKRLGGHDQCVVIELEEANDKIFTKNNDEISKEVFDGINQTVQYVITQRANGEFSRGLAIVGYFDPEKITKKQELLWDSLKNNYQLIEILSYGDIIRKSHNTLQFWEGHKQDILK